MNPQNSGAQSSTSSDDTRVDTSAKDGPKFAPSPHSSRDSAESPTFGLRTEVQFLPAIGHGRLPMMRRLGIRTAADLLFHFPRSHEAPADLVEETKFEAGERVSFLGRVVDLDERWTERGKHVLGVQVATEHGATQVRLVWFNQPFRKSALFPNRRLLVTGVLKSTVLHWEIVQPQVRYLEEEEGPPTEKPLPIYPLTEGLKQFQLRSIMQKTLPQLIEHISEVLPPSVRQSLGVVDIQTALDSIHFPQSMEHAAEAIRRFKLQELFVLQLAITMQRRQREHLAVAPACEPSGKIHARILNRLGFTLTGDQLKAIEDVSQDMARTLPMNRLLQGDVGSGKTVVAQYAMLLSVAHGFQAALMAPTDVLASQHARTLETSLGSSRVRVCLITGSLPKREREQRLARIAAGEIELVVGTQALLSEQLVFNNLGLVIVDEQHKFGVLQRAKLRVDGEQPHYLVLSATPIPRTIAMTEFGDLDVSTIREKPPGRASVKSYIAQRHELDSWWKFVENKIAEGRQAFVIAPRVGRIEDSATEGTFQDMENSQEALGEAKDGTTKDGPSEDGVAKAGPEKMASAEGVFADLRDGVFSQRRLGLLHGRLHSTEKDAVLQAFARGEIDILVATTVVEVGIDVPNASVMTILDADRLGLSQLHQLRGRVGRGSFAGAVCAVASEGCNAQEHERLKAFESCNDGFELAELDLKLRGPGDLLGTSQSGLPPLRVANLVEDQEFLTLARQVSIDTWQESNGLEGEEWAALRKQTLGRYGDFLALSDVG